MNCRTCRTHLDMAAGRDGAPDEVVAHLRSCHKCREYAALRDWARGVVRAGAVAVPEAPPMAAVWAAIRRQSSAAWDGSLSMGLRRLAPYLASITVLLLLAGSMALSGTGGAVTAAPAASMPSAQSLLAPSATVAQSMPVNFAAQRPTDWLGVGNH